MTYATLVVRKNKLPTEYFINYNDSCYDCHSPKGSSHSESTIRKYHSDAKEVPEDIRDVTKPSLPVVTTGRKEGSGNREE